MCTVTYLPKKNHSFILTHNRDEHVTRGIALLPEKKRIHSTETIMPIDSKAGGTWIATSKKHTLCLLNGGFEKHITQAHYRHSRGHIIPDFFLHNHVAAFTEKYHFDELEPFTLIIVENQTAEITEIVYDGNKLHKTLVDHQKAHIWSSSTLYTADDRNRRLDYFKRFLQENDFSKDAIIAFHENKFETYEHEGIQINRNNILQTVSLTSIHKSTSMDFLYKDFIHQKTVSIAL